MATSPTSASLTSSLGLGTYTSTSGGGAQANSCTNFQWTINQVTATGVSGSFSATCNGTVNVSGTGSANATISGNGITWSGTATGSVPGNSNCSIALSGTVEVTSTGLRIPYSGTTCFGAVSGTELLGKK